MVKLIYVIILTVTIISISVLLSIILFAIIFYFNSVYPVLFIIFNCVLFGAVLKYKLVIIIIMCIFVINIIVSVLLLILIYYISNNINKIEIRFLLRFYFIFSLFPDFIIEVDPSIMKKIKEKIKGYK